MRKLEIGDSYKHIGFTLTVTKREKDIVFAENEAYGIEVFKIKNKKPREFSDGRISEGGEFPPGTSVWGHDSGYWRNCSRPYAEKYFTELVSSAGKKK